MAQVQKSSSVHGKWLDKKLLKNGEKIKITNEALEQPNPQGDGVQLVAKVLVQGRTEAENVSINTPSKNALIDAFGSDTKEWVGKIVTANVEKVVVGGKRGTALYLVPDGFVLKESNDGFLYIGHPDSESGTQKGEVAGSEAGTAGTGKPEYPDENINIDDIPF